MKALLRFVGLGVALFAIAGRANLLVSRDGERRALSASAQPELRPPSLDAEARLLDAALARRMGDDDVVVQRRLLQNARALEVGGDAYRQAVSLGLDAGDPIVARRLVQQMRLQLETEARQSEPTDVELRQYLADHAEHFMIPARVQVEHVFYSRARRGERADVDARCSIGLTADEACPPSFSGDPSLWPSLLPLQSSNDLEKIFGAAAAVIADSPVGIWTGPHRSALGFHVVRVIERVPATMPAFETVRVAVRLALLNERGEAYVAAVLR